MKKTCSCETTVSRLGVLFWAAVVLAGILSILLTTGPTWWDQTSVGTNSSTFRTPGKNVTFFTKLKADSRTVVAALNYLLEPDIAPAAAFTYIAVVTNSHSPNFASPTNLVGKRPTV